MHPSNPSLQDTHPEIAQGWHPEKNGQLKPEDVTARSQRKVWWRCLQNPEHEWQQNVYRQLYHRCSFCAMEKNNLLVLFPTVAQQWHPTKNDPLTPDDVTCGSNRKIWWQCPENKDHVWEAMIYNRANNLTGCPTCARVNSANSLANLFPEIAKEWHPTRNGHLFPSWDPASIRKRQNSPQKNRRLKPSDFAAYSNEDAWWQCSKVKLHAWSTQISNRTMNGYGCPFCSGKKVAIDNCLAEKFPGVAKRWHPTRNLPLTPEEVTAGSIRLAWWRCPKSPLHVWQQQVFVVTRSYKAKTNGCPFCTGRKIGKDTNLAAKFPEVAKLWHPSRNLPLTASELLPGSSEIVWWQCTKSDSHTWKTTVSNVVRARNSKSHGCPFCSGLKVARGESFASLHPELLKYWDKARNLAVNPKQVGPGAHTVVFWRCPESSEHTWTLPVREMVRRASRCLFCDREGRV